MIKFSEMLYLRLSILFSFLENYFSSKYSRNHVYRRLIERANVKDVVSVYDFLYKEIVDYHDKNLVLITKDKTYYYKVKINNVELFAVRQKFNKKNKVIQTVLTKDQMINVINNNEIVWRKNESFS